ncbi:MAG: leucyl/phenylalanyl-tRNA--protein transferase [Candidatus Solibacter sp.]|nr:leucyl/phenylalanyl-tRNA--protein transferase [Candidatus Solibacter sp.]
MESDLVGVSRDLDARTVLDAYRAGVFPMGGGRAITWHCPRVRAVIPLDAVRVPRSLSRRMRRGGFEITCDTAFGEVMLGCAGRQDTWIDARILRVYQELYESGDAHSLEVWVDGALAAGIYGVQIGGAFFAESKFHRVTDMSKIALVKLADRLRLSGFDLLEVQYVTPHLARFGAVGMGFDEYLRRVEHAAGLRRRF